jgi:hypothetical protein
MLIAEVKRQNKPYGLYFDQVVSGYTTTARRGLQAFTVVPLVVYRVYPDGRPDELIRGVDIVGTPLASFAKILATSDQDGRVQRNLRRGVRAMCRCRPWRRRSWFRKSRSSARSGRRTVRRIWAGRRSRRLIRNVSGEITRRDFDRGSRLIACFGFARERPKFIANPGAADDDPILRAMRDELDRSRQLRVVGGGDAVPYFLSYSLSDATSFHVAASFGAALAVSRNRFRVPEIEVRVGNYDFDNTGHIYSGIYTGSKFDGGWPLDDSYATLRECFWLGTDRAYKTAIESMSRKRAALNNASVPAEKLADYSQAETVKYIAKAVRGKLDDAAWQARVVKLSAIFNSYPEVLSAGVEFQAIQGDDLRDELRRNGVPL